MDKRTDDKQAEIPPEAIKNTKTGLRPVAHPARTIKDKKFISLAGRIRQRRTRNLQTRRQERLLSLSGSRESPFPPVTSCARNCGQAAFLSFLTVGLQPLTKEYKMISRNRLYTRCCCDSTCKAELEQCKPLEAISGRGAYSQKRNFLVTNHAKSTAKGNFREFKQ